MIAALTRISLLPMLIGILFIFAAIGTVIWMYVRGSRSGGDAQAQAVEVGRIATRSQLDIVRNQIDELSREIADPRVPFDRSNRRQALRSGVSQAEYESATAANRLARVARLSERRAALVNDRDRLNAELSEPAPGRSFGEWLSGYSIVLLMLPFAFLGVYVLRVSMADRLPDRNPAGLSDSNRRGLLFVLACSLFGLTVVVIGLAVLANS